MVSTWKPCVCAQVVMQYLRDYPLGKKIGKHFEFYTQQLSYEMEDGRMSALKVLRTIFCNFDEVGLTCVLSVPTSVRGGRGGGG